MKSFYYLPASAKTCLRPSYDSSNWLWRKRHRSELSTWRRRGFSCHDPALATAKKAQIDDREVIDLSVLYSLSGPRSWHAHAPARNELEQFSWYWNHTLRLFSFLHFKKRNQPESCSSYRVLNPRSVVHGWQLGPPLSLILWSIRRFRTSSFRQLRIAVGFVGPLPMSPRTVILRLNFPSPPNIVHQRCLALDTSTQPSVALVSQ